MKILFVGSEAIPFISTGGLGDVLGSLPAALVKNSADNDIRVVLPLFKAIKEKLMESMRQFDQKMQLEREKLSFEKTKHQDDIAVKKQQIASRSKSTPSKK